MKAYFDQFQRALGSVIEHDWDDLYVLFAPDAVVKLSMEGLEGDRVASPPEAFADFQATLRRFKHKLLYLGGSGLDCVFSFAAYARTRSGDSAMYSGHGYLEFSDDGDITRLNMYSSDSQELANAIHEQLQITGLPAEGFHELDVDVDEVSF
jgi:hypothetical protein